MADDLHYVPGDNYLLDDISGFKIRASRARIIPGGQTGQLAVAPARWEPQQPQDFVSGVIDDQAAELVRSRQPNQFTYLSTTVAAPAARLTGSVTVSTVAGFLVNDNVFIMLDSGENQLNSIAAIAGSSFSLGVPLGASVGTLYGDPIENLIVFYQHGPSLVTGFWNDGGVLAILYPSLLPIGSGGLAAGAVYDNGGVVAIVPGVGPGTLSLTFGQVSQGYLIALGGGQLPTSATPASGLLYNNGGEVAIA